MSKMNKYEFNNEIESQNEKFELNWPVVYILENGKQLYVGETNNFKKRMKQHYKNPVKKKLSNIHMIYDDEFNKSAIRDIESTLISYFDADKKYELLNLSSGSFSHEYFGRMSYKNKIPSIWKRLQGEGLAHKDIFELENSDVFKFSPFKSLSTDQFEISRMILADVKGEQSISIIEGNPGTGKTVLAIYLLKILTLIYKDDEIALVVPMTSLRKTLKQVVKTVKGLKANQIIGPSEVNKRDYKVLLVDEAHRLKRRVNLPNMGSFDDTNRYFNLGNEGTQLDWIKKSSKHLVMFYDENQSIKPTDVRPSQFSEFKQEGPNTTIYELISQHRVKGGYEAIKYFENVLNCSFPKRRSFKDYTISYIENFKVFNEKMYDLNNQHNLVRMVSGYSFKWVSKTNKELFDIEIEGIKKKWNTVAEDWINSHNSLNEVGCIHTVQGYDLNYIFIIFGFEIDYDASTNTITINKDMYFDKYGKQSILNDGELKQYILNIYKTLMSRGINGVFMYACNKNMKDFLRKNFGDQNE